MLTIADINIITTSLGQILFCLLADHPVVKIGYMSDAYTVS